METLRTDHPGYLVLIRVRGPNIDVPRITDGVTQLSSRRNLDGEWSPNSRGNPHHGWLQHRHIARGLAEHQTAGHGQRGLLGGGWWAMACTGAVA